MKNYLCSKCSTSLQSEKSPAVVNCPKGGHHQWSDLGETGPNNYQCRKCGLLLKSKNSPGVVNCSSGGHHQWSKL